MIPFDVEDAAYQFTLLNPQLKDKISSLSSFIKHMKHKNEEIQTGLKELIEMKGSTKSEFKIELIDSIWEAQKEREAKMIEEKLQNPQTLLRRKLQQSVDRVKEQEKKLRAGALQSSIEAQRNARQSLEVVNSNDSVELQSKKPPAKPQTIIASPSTDQKQQNANYIIYRSGMPNAYLNYKRTADYIPLESRKGSRQNPQRSQTEQSPPSIPMKRPITMLINSSAEELDDSIQREKVQTAFPKIIVHGSQETLREEPLFPTPDQLDRLRPNTRYKMAREIFAEEEKSVTSKANRGRINSKVDNSVNSLEIGYKPDKSIGHEQRSRVPSQNLGDDLFASGKTPLIKKRRSIRGRVSDLLSKCSDVSGDKEMLLRRIHNLMIRNDAMNDSYLNSLNIVKELENAEADILHVLYLYKIKDMGEALEERLQVADEHMKKNLDVNDPINKMLRKELINKFHERKKNQGHIPGKTVLERLDERDFNARYKIRRKEREMEYSPRRRHVNKSMDIMRHLK